MSKKLFGKAAGVLALVIGMAFISCDDKVTVNISKAPAVKAVTVTKTTNNQYFIVSWDSVREDVSYEVHSRQDGKTSSSSIDDGQNNYTFDPDTGEPIENTDLNKWSYRVGGEMAAAGSFSFGVRTKFNYQSMTQTASAITWSTPFAIAAGPKVASVSASATTDKRYIIVTWNAVTGADRYNVYMGKDNDESAYVGRGDDAWAYGVADGAQTTNTDESKWSFRFSDITGYPGVDEGSYRFAVRAYDDDIDDIGVAQGIKVFTTTSVTITED